MRVAFKISFYRNSVSIWGVKTVNNQKTYEDIAAVARKITDGLGKPIDKGIFETVVVLNCLGFPTTASCAGHLNRALAAPWVDIALEMDKEARKLMARKEEIYAEIEKRELKGFSMEQNSRLLTKYHKVLAEMRKPSEQMIMEFLGLLDEFYQGRTCSVDIRLVVGTMGFRGYRLTNQGEIVQSVRSVQERRRKLEEYCREMEDFTRFLKDKLGNWRD